jgi:hypothetical protein
MSVDTKSFAQPLFNTGRFTSAGSAADVTEVLGYQPTLVIAFIDIGGTNPNMLVKSAAEADESMLTTGSTGVITSPADTSAITLTTTGFTVVAAGQVNSGVNAWIAFK